WGAPESGRSLRTKSKLPCLVATLTRVAAGTSSVTRSAAGVTTSFFFFSFFLTTADWTLNLPALTELFFGAPSLISIATILPADVLISPSQTVASWSLTPKVMSKPARLAGMTTGASGAEDDGPSPASICSGPYLLTSSTITNVANVSSAGQIR